jgi:hypothetical protein
MSDTDLGVSAFISQFGGGGARANLYIVDLQPPAKYNLDRKHQVLAKAASLPTSTIGVAPVSYMGRTIKLAGDRTFDDYNVTFYNDLDFHVRGVIESWINDMNANVSNIGASAPSSYFGAIDVYQLAKSKQKIYKYSFRHVFPTTITDIALGADTVDAVEEFSATCALTDWTSKNECSGVEMTPEAVMITPCLSTFGGLSD